MIFSILMYCFSTVLLIGCTIIFYKKFYFSWQKIFLISCSCLCLASASYHSIYYGIKTVEKAALDQECFYYPQINITYKNLEVNLFQNFVDKTIHFKQHNLLYPLIYWNIKACFGRFFLEGFFFTCILNSILFLFSIYLLFKLFNYFNISKHFLWLCCFIFFQPFMIFRNALPLANSLTIFSSILFIYTMISDKKLSLKILSLFLCYLAHKTLYLPSIATSFYLMWTYSKNYSFKIIVFLLFITILFFNIDVFKQNIRISIVSSSHGNSYIPTTFILNKILNFYFSPLFTNLNQFFYKAHSGNLLGWIYAIYINFIYLFMFIKICFSMKSFPFLTQSMKITAKTLIIFIVLFAIEGVRLRNYLTANRHATNTLVFWIFLMLILESGYKKIKDKS